MIKAAIFSLFLVAMSSNLSAARLYTNSSIVQIDADYFVDASGDEILNALTQKKFSPAYHSHECLGLYLVEELDRAGIFTLYNIRDCQPGSKCSSYMKVYLWRGTLSELPTVKEALHVAEPYLVEDSSPSDIF